MSPASPELAGLCDALGVATHYWDWQGREAAVESETLIGVLKALGIDASSPESIGAARWDLEVRPWRRPLPACTVAQQGSPVRVAVHVPAGTTARVWVVLENGGARDLDPVVNDTPDREVDGTWLGEGTFEGRDLPIGYHVVHLETVSGRWEAPLIVTPSFLGFPAAMGDRRIWGLAAQLYSVRSERSWAVGDFADLTDLAIWSGAAHHADFVLVNPLHAAEPRAPLEPSPYLPSSRRRINPLYIRPEAIPEFAALPGKARRRIRGLRTDLAWAPDRIERDQSWTAKLQALRIIHDHGLSPARAMARDHFIRCEGRSLTDFATWCVLTSIHGPDWREWPTELQDPDSPAVARAVAGQADEIEFHQWMQWVASQQLGTAQAAARDVGMCVGIVNDLAVGIGQGSADAWILGDALATGVSVGCPADQYNQLGQDWGQAPWRPDRLAELGYRPFRETVAAMLRHAGGVRIDHIMGLFRLWWIPNGLSAAHGTYVRYDHEAMVGIVALEAQRAGALVVGEDLGTVEPWVRDHLDSRGILGTSVVWFESAEDGSPLPPEQYRENCLASVTTHDMPPTAGYLAGDHIRLRHALGLLTGGLDDNLAGEMQVMDRMRRTLVGRGFLATEETDPFEQSLALHRFLVAGRARVLCAALTDAVGERRTQNQPGVVDGYPNWCVPLAGSDGVPLTLEEIITSDGPARLAAVMNRTE